MTKKEPDWQDLAVIGQLAIVPMLG